MQRSGGQIGPGGNAIGQTELVPGKKGGSRNRLCVMKVLRHLPGTEQLSADSPWLLPKDRQMV